MDLVRGEGGQPARRMKPMGGGLWAWSQLINDPVQVSVTCSLFKPGFQKAFEDQTPWSYPRCGEEPEGSFIPFNQICQK